MASTGINMDNLSVYLENQKWQELEYSPGVFGHELSCSILFSINHKYYIRSDGYRFFFGDHPCKVFEVFNQQINSCNLKKEVEDHCLFTDDLSCHLITERLLSMAVCKLYENQFHGSTQKS